MAEHNSAVENVVYPHHRHSSEILPAADAAATLLVSLLFFCLLCFILGAWVLARRSRNAASWPLPQQSDSVTQPPQPKKTPPAWERDPDWWKKE